MPACIVVLWRENILYLNYMRGLLDVKEVVEEGRRELGKMERTQIPEGSNLRLSLTCILSAIRFSFILEILNWKVSLLARIEGSCLNDDFHFAYLCPLYMNETVTYGSSGCSKNVIEKHE